MTALMKDGITLVFIALLALTGLSLASSANPHIDNKWISVLLLSISFYKVRLIIMHLMEVSTANRPLQWLFEGWLITVFVVTLYLLS